MFDRDEQGGDGYQDATWPSLALASGILAVADLVNVFLTGRFVICGKVLGGVPAEPVGELGQLLSETVHGLLVHIGLRNELRKSGLSGDHRC